MAYVDSYEYMRALLQHLADCDSETEYRQAALDTLLRELALIAERDGLSMADAIDFCGLSTGGAL